MDEVDERFTNDLVSKLTHLRGEALNDFMFRYRPEYSWIHAATDYDILKYIKEKLKDFLDTKNKSHY